MQAIAAGGERRYKKTSRFPLYSDGACNALHSRSAGEIPQDGYQSQPLFFVLGSGSTFLKKNNLPSKPFRPIMRLNSRFLEKMIPVSWARRVTMQH